MDVAQFIQDRERVEEEVESIEGHHSNRSARPTHSNQRRTPIALTSLDPEVQLIVHALLDPTLPIPANTTAAHPPRDGHARIPPPPPPRV